MQPLLLMSEWVAIERTCSNRMPTKCSICQDCYSISDQVLTSCGHLFHRKCLNSYERFTGCKKCPNCRSDGYQRLKTSIGMKIVRNKAAAKYLVYSYRIQATWRMHRDQNSYIRYRRSHMPKQPILIQKYCLEKISGYNSAMAADISESAESLRALFVQLDSNISNSQIWGEMLDRENGESFEHVADDESAKPLWELPSAPILSSAWKAILERVENRGALECAICIQSIILPSSSMVIKKPIKLLDCSHVFHATCLQSCEQFGSKNCPICRSEYTAIVLSKLVM